MTDVFISYKREERENARRLAEALQKHGYSVWWDAEILPGEKYRARTLETLQSCSAAIVIWSPQSIQSNWVLDEAQSALDRGVLVPVMIETIAKYPLGFGQTHAHDLTAWDGRPDHAALRPVLAAIARLIGKVEDDNERDKKDEKTKQDEKRPVVETASAFDTYELGFIAAVSVFAAFIAWPITNMAMGYAQDMYPQDARLVLSLATPQNIFIMTPLLVGLAWAYDRAQAWIAAQGKSPKLMQYGALAALALFFLFSLRMREHDGRETHMAVWLLFVWVAATYARPAIAWLRPRVEQQLARLKNGRAR